MAAASPAPTPALRVVCWNVAGLTSTVAIVDSLLQSSGKCFLDYLDAFEADVVCLQEAKIPQSRLAEEPWLAGACVRGGDQRGWESYWAYAMKNWNGVVTFAKAGLVVRATNKVFDDDEFDREGRCVATYFSNFVLFNVYVPNARQGLRSDFRAAFVRRLRSAMSRVRRETGLPVILAGDLNMSYRAADCTWTGRRIDVDALATCAPGADTRLDEWLPPAQRRAMLNSILLWLKWSPLPQSFQLGDSTAWKSHVILSTGAESGAVVADAEVQEPAPAVGAVYLDPFLPKASEPNAAINIPWYKLSTLFGRPAHSSEAVTMLGTELIAEDGMVDAFVHAIPRLRGRYTAFSQLENRRFSNQGNRIDYFLVDAPLAPLIVASPAERYVSADAIGEDGWVGMSEFYDGLVFKDGLRDLTEGGKFSAAPFSGGGLAALSKPLMDLQYKSDPCATGFIYTAPQLSDHIALRLVLNLPLVPRATTAVRDAATKVCQFTPANRSIKAMFSKVIAQQAATVNVPSVPPQALPAPPTKMHRRESTASSKGSFTSSSSASRVDVCVVSSSDDEAN